METCGILPVYKPAGPTSHDVVDRVRRLFGTRRVGHTGTLDPLAEGLLVLCLGQATKVARYFSEMDKTYRVTIRLGQRTTTGDAEGAPLDSAETQGITVADIENVLAHFRGVIRQRVPAHSAVKVRGRRLYSYAREGAEVPEVVRDVEILDIALEEFDNPDLTITARCSSGTYIRSLAEDLGNRLGCGGYLSSLTRTKIGDYDCAAAEKLDALEKLRTQEERAGRLRPIEEFLPFPAVIISDDRVAFVREGRRILSDEVQEITGCFRQGDKVLICDRARRTLAVGAAVCDSQALAETPATPWFRYERVLI